MRDETTRSDSRFVRFVGIIVVCLAAICFAAAQENQEKPKKTQPQHLPLPSGPTGPIPQLPLDSVDPVSPQVKYENGRLTIIAENSTLADILRAVHKVTSAEIDVPDANERVVTNLGPGPASKVLAGLLNGSHYNYVLLFSREDPKVLTKVVLMARTTTRETAGPDMAQAPRGPVEQPGNTAAASDHPDDDNGSDVADAEAQHSSGQGAVLVQPPQAPPQQSGSMMRQQQGRTPFLDPTPEPGTLVLVCSGLLGLALKRKFRRRTSRP